MERIYNIAGLNILIDAQYKETEIFLKNFEVKNLNNFDESIKISQLEFDRQMELVNVFEPSFVEHQCILSRLCAILINKYNGCIFHGSAVKYNDAGYIFTAPSGTGKSTHVNNLKKLLGSEIEYINDDKPIIKVENNIPYVYGSPWQGKHYLGGNIKTKLKAIIFLVRSEENFVKELSFNEFLCKLLSQIQNPNSSIEGQTLLDIILAINNSQVKFYVLNCNKEMSSANCTFENILKR